MLLYDKVIHLVPEYPPIVGGVSDFAAIIREAMEQWEIPQEVIVAGIKPYESTADSTVSVGGKKDLLQQLTARAGTKTLLVFHYVCYGYSLKGIPLFLPGIIRKIKKNKDVTILTYFHELYATEFSPLKSAFWLGPIQKRLAKKLAYISDYRITTSIAYKKELDEWCATTQNKNLCIPVFSNIPESTDVTNWNKKDKLVVFGSRGARNKVYREQAIIEELLEKTKQFDWIDIGFEVQCNTSIEKKGLLNADEVATIFHECKLGLINYEDMPIEKSGVFAAYAANGVVPLVMSCNKTESIYAPGTHYILYNYDLNIDNIPVDRIRTDLYKRYMETASVASHIKIIQNLLTN